MRLEMCSCTIRLHLSRGLRLQPAAALALSQYTPQNSRRQFTKLVYRTACRKAQAAQGISRASSGWHPIASPLLWQGSEEDALQAGSVAAQLPPAWKVILFSGGSVTRHLQLVTGRAVSVDCFQMQHIAEGEVGLPAATAAIQRPLLQRQVLLRTPDRGDDGRGTALVYATSWWNATHVDEYLQDKDAPIWVSLSKGRTELYRDIQLICYGNCDFIQRKFQKPGPFWGRQYLFWHNRRPLTLIYEVFSSSLEAYLGPCAA